MARSSTVRPLAAALLLLAGLWVAACSDDEPDLATEATDLEAREEVDAAIPAPNTARLTFGDDEQDVVLNQCVAQTPGNLTLSGSTGDGSTLQVEIGPSVSDVSWGEFLGSDVEMSNEPAERTFQVTGLFEPVTPGAGDGGSGSFTIVGRCAE